MTALRPTPPSRIARRPPRGVSIVELMVGITIGLFILAAATVMLTSQLADNRRLLLEAQVQQDLRATADRARHPPGRLLGAVLQAGLACLRRGH